MRYYSPGMATPTFRTDRLVDNNANDAWINDMMFPLPIGTEERISVEDAFFYYHDTMKLEDNPPQLFCRNVRLYFATVTFPSLNQTIACIVKESRDTLNDSCSHGLGPDEIQAVLIDPIIVARLCFFQLLVTSMATVMTFARQGTRIAVASWDKIFVWPFLPEILAEIRDDCQTYRKTYDRNLQCNLVELKPIILKAEAVVHKMAFGASGNELITITDKGLQIWNLGPSATGLRRVNRLPEDEQDENGDSSYLKSPQAPKITRRCLRAPAEDRRDVRPC